MKVAFCIRKDYNTRGGGDVVQILKTKEYLEKNNSDVLIDIITNVEELNKSYQICHVFNLSLIDDAFKFVIKAKELELKVVCSTIYWDYSVISYHKFAEFGFFYLNELILTIEKKIYYYLSQLFKRETLVSKRFKDKVLEINKYIDLYLPNSVEELTHLENFINLNLKQKSSIIYNATELKQNTEFLDVLEKYSLPEDYILQVGRIEPIKNQLSLLMALMHEKHIPIVFLGKPFNNRYYDILKKYSLKRGNVFFINEVNHEEVYSFYKYAKVHVLMSLRESPGLVSLEAMACGCNIVVSKYPYAPVDTYFSDFTFIADPLSLKDIKEKVLAALKSDVNSYKLIQYVEKFNWNTTSIQTYNAYLKVLVK
jgi:glycosyltransferase involved in cell wall biosynthesis